ncbi:cell division protein PerM [Saccharothrix sp. Mg75]|uniref:cell division protein PerM n=1 Tax=Saccharothrix sp. Mg75 TaxID=3445357 RepID=UPI003EEE500A
MTDSVRPPEFSRAERVRVLTTTAAGSVVVGYAAVAALLALISSTAAHASFSTTGVLTAAAPGWLVAHHVPIRFDGGQLGMLPLLPTALVMLLVYRAAASAADRLGLFEPLQARSVVFSISGTHAVVGGVITFLMGDDGVVRATPAVAFFGCAAVSAVAAVAGVAQRCGLVEVVFERIDPVARRGLRAGALALFALTAAGALVLALGLLFSWSTTAVLFDQTGGTIGTGLGIWLLCLAYLPNAVVGALSYVVGAGFSLGSVVVRPLEFVGGPVPAVPLLAALPEQQAGYLPLVLVLPGALGVLVGFALRNAAGTPRARVRAVLVAAVTAAVGLLVLAAVSGGALGSGAFNPVTIPAGLLAVLTLAWIGVPGAIVAWFSGPRPVRAPAPAPEPVTEAVEAEPGTAEEADDEYDDEEYDDENEDDYEEEDDLDDVTDDLDDPEDLDADDPEDAADFQDAEDDEDADDFEDADDLDGSEDDPDDLDDDLDDDPDDDADDPDTEPDDDADTEPDEDLDEDPGDGPDEDPDAEPDLADKPR